VSGGSNTKKERWGKEERITADPYRLSGELLHSKEDVEHSHVEIISRRHK